MAAQPIQEMECPVLLSYLNAQREHALGILAGLDESALRRPVLPSGWTCLGLVQHLTLDVERFWFRAVVAGEPAAINELAQTADAWQVAPEVPPRQFSASTESRSRSPTTSSP